MSPIRPEHSSMKGTSTSPHTGEQRAGKPALQSRDAVEPLQHVSRIPSIELVSELKVHWAAASGSKKAAATTAVAEDSLFVVAIMALVLPVWLRLSSVYSCIVARNY